MKNYSELLMSDFKIFFLRLASVIKSEPSLFFQFNIFSNGITESRYLRKNRNINGDSEYSYIGLGDFFSGKVII